MKNGKKAIGLALTALTVVSLSSCFDVTQKDKGEILTYDYNGTSLKVSTDDIIKKYLNEDRTEHAKAFYDALYEIVVRASFEDGQKLARYSKQVQNEAKESISDEKDTADNTGKSWHDYLEEKGYNEVNTTDEEREQEFYLDKLYEGMKKRVDTEFKNKFNVWKKTETELNDKLQNEHNTLWGKNGYLTQKLPYHVKHILVKVDAAETTGEYSRGHISSANVEKLYQTITSLVNGTPFSAVAKNFSDDPGSAEKDGEYIMNIETSFVNEFQLGIYTYDTILNPEYKNEAGYSEKKNKLHIPTAVEDQLKDFGVTYIPYGVVEEMHKIKDIEKHNGISIYNGDADYFPRNIYFNKYFQNRNVAFITNESAWTTEQLQAEVNNKTGYHKVKDPISGNEVYTDIDSDSKNNIANGTYLTSGTATSIDNTHFKKLEGSIIDKPVLCDTDGNPILVVRNQEASAGIHFIVVERSAFDESDVHFNAQDYIKEGIASVEEANKYKTSLNEYYATVNPKEKDGYNSTTGKPFYVDTFPSVESTVAEGAKVSIPKKTYVQTSVITPTNEVYYRISDYDKRITAVNEELSTMDSVTKFSKYYWLNDGLNIELKNFQGMESSSIQNLVTKYIETQQKTISRNQEKAIQDRWHQYARSIKEQSNERIYNLLPEILAADYGNPELYKKGQPGYNPKYDTINGHN